MATVFLNHDLTQVCTRQLKLWFGCRAGDTKFWSEMVFAFALFLLFQTAFVAEACADFKNAESLVDQSEALIRDRKFDEAERCLKRSIKLNPNIAEAHHNLGLVYARLGQNRKALSQFEIAVKLNPRMSQTWLMLASAQQAIGHIELAISSYDQFLIKFPENKQFDRIKSLRDGLQAERDKIANTAGQSNWKWTKMPLSVFVGALPPEAQHVFRNAESLESVLQDAFKHWQSASKGLVQFTFTSERNNADIECRFIQDAEQLENSAEAGQCEFYLNDEKEPRCIIKFQVNPMSDTAQDIESVRFKRIALHEIGHALGIVDHSKNPVDIMFYSTLVAGKIKLSDSDIERLRALYIRVEHP